MLREARAPLAIQQMVDVRFSRTTPNFVDTSRTPKNLAVNWRWSPTPTLTNEAIFGLSKFFFSFATPTPDENFPFAFLNPATPNTNFSYNARGVRTLQFIDNLTLVRGSHTLKGGINFRFNQHRDDRSSVAASAIEPVVTFSNAEALYTGFGLPTVTGINTNDLTRLRSTIGDLLGKVGSVSRAFVLDPENSSAFLPAGSRWLNEADYTELDFYFQDNWRVRSNFVLDLGLRWEPKLTPSIANGRPILVPNQPVKLGAAPSNTLKWVEGELFGSDLSKILPSVGFAWDPFDSGKTSIRGNYRIASDRIATFLFGSSIYQSTPGNAVGPANSTFGNAGGLYRNVGPVIANLVPSQTPDALRQPAPFSVARPASSIRICRFPQVHEWSLSLQREIGNNVVEVNYIGKHAVHLLGGYNVNQVNIFASRSRSWVRSSFLDAFNRIRASSSYNSPLINLTHDW